MGLFDRLSDKSQFDFIVYCQSQALSDPGLVSYGHHFMISEDDEERLHLDQITTRGRKCAKETYTRPGGGIIFNPLCS